MFETRNSAGAELKSYFLGHFLSRKQSFGLVVWRVMRRNVWQDIANWKIKRLIKCTKSLFHAWATISSKRKNRKRFENVQKVCSQIVLTCLCVAGMVGFDRFWFVNTFAQVVTQWTRAFDQLLVCLISYITTRVITGTIVMWLIRHRLSIEIAPILRF